MDGGIVVQDCLALLGALLRGSPPNQLMFRETGFLSQLPPLLALDPAADGAGRGEEEGEEGEGLSHQKAANLAALLELVLLLVAPPPAGAAAASGQPSQHLQNQAVLLQHGLLDALVALALRGGGAPDAGVRAQASDTRGGGLACRGRRIVCTCLL